MQLLQWQTKGNKKWTKCLTPDCAELFPEARSDDDLGCSNYTKNYSQLSAFSTMSQNITPTFVYKRRRPHTNSVGIFAIHPCAGTLPSDGCHSAISCEAPSLTAQENMNPAYEHATEVVRSPAIGPVGCNRVATASCNGFHAEEEAGSEEALTIDVGRVLNVCSANENCSSSKSNLELNSASLKIDMDDAGECSSSGALIADKVSNETSERDICISILRSQGILDKVWNRKDRASTGFSGVSSHNYCSKSCRVCEHMGSTSSMLICDNCEDAFHIACYNPHMTILPVGEWLCKSCLKKKHKILKDSETSRTQYSASEGELGSLVIMLSDTEPYMSNVRVGDEFQADVPDWSGPIYEESDPIADLVETDSSNNCNTREGGAIKTLKLSSIGNWLQCREFIEGTGEGVDGHVCAKWRRAPLFEVQTDNWECFRCILWDPAHADCAVPQELDTEEVMKQLKYIEMLRPKLAAKRRKLDGSKSSGSQDRSSL